MNKQKLLDKIIDLVFDKHCRMKEVTRYEDKLVCDNLSKMKQDLKESLTILFEEENE